MAARAQPVSAASAAGLGAAGTLAALTLVPLAALAGVAGGFGGLGPGDWSALRFTVLQAALSACASVALAIPVARALARRRFPGHGALVTLMGAPFLLPVIVAVQALVAVFGRAGLVNDGLGALGLPPIDIYGLGGVVLAHVFLNLPLAVRLLLGGWQRIPAERLRLAAALGFGRREMWRHFEAPLLREVVPGALAVVFLICCTSFAVALILGGGPRATTLELAIYQAFRFDFDLARAATLGLLQMALCAVGGLIVQWVALPRALGATLDRRRPAWPGLTRPAALLDALSIFLAAAFLVIPLSLVALRGVGALWSLPPSVWEAAGRSFLLAMASALLAVAMSLALAALAGR
ncbi:MAG: thiamine/thiamine pyrophosphate ABC transporter permease ThiP, partial [Pseudomonadota bacterium]